MWTLPTMPLGFKFATTTPGVICSHGFIKEKWSPQKTLSYSQRFRRIKPLCLPKHLVLKMSCSDNSKAVMLHPLSAIAVFRTLVEFYQKPFLKIVAFATKYSTFSWKVLSFIYWLQFWWISMQRRLNIEVNIQLLFFGKRQQLLTYSILWQSVNFFVENIVIQITIHMLKSLNKNFAKFNIITENWRKSCKL